MEEGSLFCFQCVAGGRFADWRSPLTGGGHVMVPLFGRPALFRVLKRINVPLNVVNIEWKKG